MSMFALMAATMLQAQAVDQPPRIVVEGSGTVKSPPDIAMIDYEVRGEGKTNDDALKSLVATADRVAKALKSIDPSLAPKVGNLKVSAVRGAECKMDRYDRTAQLSTGECAVVGYVAIQNFIVVTPKVTEVATMVGLAGRNGATDPEISKFDLADPKPAKNQAIAAALADARAKAQAVAQGSGLVLGPMIVATLDSARDFDLNGTVTVETLLNELPQVMAPSPVTVVVAPKDIETTAKVIVTYAVQR
jgi:uncharacterized protein